jgi:phosphoglycolate phosphatase-like HAD superfamily hydrolase
VIGDTPLDIACARAADAWVVAVATGSFSTADLAPHQPDLLLPDLTDPDRFVGFVRDLPARQDSGPA